jgi:hypothetical protein
VIRSNHRNKTLVRKQRRAAFSANVELLLTLLTGPTEQTCRVCGQMHIPSSIPEIAALRVCDDCMSLAVTLVTDKGAAADVAELDSLWSKLPKS